MLLRLLQVFALRLESSSGTRVRRESLLYVTVGVGCVNGAKKPLNFSVPWLIVYSVLLGLGFDVTVDWASRKRPERTNCIFET